MSKRLLPWLTLALLCVGGVYTVLYLQEIELEFHAEIPDIVSIASEMNIRNLVAVIYLGPRFFDTVLEVMVVLLTVYGIKYIHSNRGDKP